MPYVDGFVIAVPTANKEVYKQYAEDAATQTHAAHSLKRIRMLKCRSMASG